MRPQNLPSLDFPVYAEEIIQSKHTCHRRRLRYEKLSVEARVQTFVPTLKSLLPLQKLKWKKLTSSAFKAGYDSPTKALGRLKDSILKDLQAQCSVNIERCPYCMIQPPSTWDHYFPQAHYPEFSFYHGNLVYVCSDCNRQKRDHHSESQLEFLHPYFYGDPSSVILFCRALITNGKLGFRYYSASLDPKLVSIAAVGQRHLVNLKLETDFQIESASIVGDFIATVKEDFPLGISREGLGRLTKKNFEMVEISLGPNAWEARLWHALASLPDFHEYVNTQLPRLPSRHREGIDQPAPPPP